jgi:hypothetical protein
VPRFESFSFPLINVIQVLCGASQNVGRSKDLRTKLSSNNFGDIRAAYVRRMVVKA